MKTLNELIITSGTTENCLIDYNIDTPVFFESTNIRYIPNKVIRVLERHISKTDLKKINPDVDVAIELCLIFLSNLSCAFYENKGGWRTLWSRTLDKQVGSNRALYLEIVKLMIKGTSNGPIIERSSNFTIKQESYRYRLTEAYSNKGVTKYEFKTNYAKNLIRKSYFEKLELATNNVIASNLIKLYARIDLPTSEELKTEAKRLIKIKYKSKKGKTLTFRNKHKDEYWSDFNSRSFVEDNIELFERLTENGYLIPTVSEERAGGRVTDSFVLMPSWIRNMIKIDGQRIVEADYSALHPNIAIKAYGGTTDSVTHQQVADELEMDLIDVKIAHLSFFNHKWENMFRSPLFAWYSKNNGAMLENMYVDKKIDHKITTKKMFKLEVDIMTAVVSELNSKGIYIGYVYDALFCTQSQKEDVLNVMNRVIKEFGVNTVAK